MELVDPSAIILLESEVTFEGEARTLPTSGRQLRELLEIVPAGTTLPGASHSRLVAAELTDLTRSRSRFVVCFLALHGIRRGVGLAASDDTIRRRFKGQLERLWFLHTPAVDGEEPRKVTLGNLLRVLVSSVRRLYRLARGAARLVDQANSPGCTVIPPDSKRNTLSLAATHQGRQLGYDENIGPAHLN